MSNAEMDAALDNLGLGTNDAEPIKAEIVEEEVEAEEIEEEELDENPPGYVSYQEWVDSGKDPDDWQGKNKYSQQYDLIQDKKDAKAEMRSLTDMVRQTAEATTALREESYQKGLAEAKAEYNQAIEDNDAQGVADARDKMDSLTPVAPARPTVNPVLGDFFASNPVLDQGSDQFDDEFQGEFARIYNGKLRADGVQPDVAISERAMKGYLKSAMDSTKTLFPDKFESPRNSRKTTTTKSKRTTLKSAPVDSIKDVKVKTKNSRDNNAMMDVYEAIKASGGQEAADAFATKMGVKA